MLLTNQHCLKGARGTPASSPRFSECPHSETLFPCFTGSLSKLLHCLNICSPQVLDKLAISHFASSNERMLANSATQGCNKVARSGRKIEQNEVPKPRPQNRQFCGNAWENQQHACYHGGTPMRHRKTACFEALVLEPHFAQSCACFLLLYCLLGWRTSLQRLKVAAHVLFKWWFAAPLPCTFQCFIRKVKNAHRR